MSASANLETNRVSRLEARVRTLTILVVTLPVVALMLGAAANDLVKAKSVTTERLIVVDSSGKERAAIYCNEKQEPVLEMYNSDHSLLINASKSPENGVGFLQYFDATGKFKGGIGGNAQK